jgi:hypothetical protein
LDAVPFLSAQHTFVTATKTGKAAVLVHTLHDWECDYHDFLPRGLGSETISTSSISEFPVWSFIHPVAASIGGSEGKGLRCCEAITKEGQEFASFCLAGWRVF